mmetsp:Transcript_14962/g.30950  ORF Transcript_14962/g.30950 Transcript_14962/m.30950 type:complete len:445 (-) Transcript_14962:906-2240(-)
MPQHSSNVVNDGKAPHNVDNINDGDKQRRSKSQTSEKKPKQKRRHPLKMPLRTDPVTNQIICRFHNYDARSGCKKYNDRKNRTGNDENVTPSCHLDHETCHICLEKGHLAHQCNHLENPLSAIWKEFCSLTLENTRPDDYPSNKTALGDVIIWIGDTATVTPKNSIQNAPLTTTMTVLPPEIQGFKLGEDDLLLRCRKQKRIEAAYMLQLQQDSVIVDVGAHLGDTVMTLALHARAKSRTDLRFVALEPCPEKCAFLRSAIAANNLQGTVEVLCAAVGDSLGTVRPAANAKDRARREGSLQYEYCPGINESDRNRDTADTPIITLDSISDQLSPLGMLHIDVEGWESNVLRGAKMLLTSVPEKHNENDKFPPCFVIAEAWTEKECLRRGVSGNSEEKIVVVMENELRKEDVDFEFERIDDVVDIERNLVYIRKKKGSKLVPQKF